MKDLEVRKKLLVAESEVYRQTMRLDVQNLRLYTIQVRRKYATYAALKPALLVAMPLVTSLFAKRDEAVKRRRRSLLSIVMTGWRMYRNFQPLVASLMAQYAAGTAFAQTGPQPGPKSRTEEDTPAAAI